MTSIIKNPKTVKDLAREIIKVCDGYWGRELSEQAGRDYIIYWSLNEGKKLYKGNEINPTIKLIIGKKRVELLEKWSEGVQIKL